MRQIAILGASRGLGASLLKYLEKQVSGAHILPMSRSHGMDFTDQDQQPQILESLERAEIETLIYVAGGGPHGNYASKEWKDHKWAYALNFEFPAMLLHHFLRQPGTIKKIIFVGSSVAESKADPGAASYSAAKHGLKGLVDSVIAENPNLIVQLYSPGYMATDLLPPNAWPRQQGIAQDPDAVARRLWQWSESTVECGTFQEAINVRREN